MPSAYKWRPLPAGALGHSVNPETIRRNEHRASLTPLETAFERARANRGNRLKQRRDFARRYDEYQALDDETKAEVDQEMIVEENEVLEQERQAILVDWRRYYPNQFGDDGLPLANPPIPIEVDSPPNSPASPVTPSPKMRPAARMKSLLDRVVKRPRSSSTVSTLVPPPGPLGSQEAPPRGTRQLAIRERSRSFTARGAPASPTDSAVGPPVALARAATFTTGSTREPISHRTRFRIGLGSLRRSSRANNPQSSK
jgi:hypothetical protein